MEGNISKCATHDLHMRKSWKHDQWQAEGPSFLDQEMQGASDAVLESMAPLQRITLAGCNACMDDVREARRDSWEKICGFSMFFVLCPCAQAFTQGIGEIELETTVEQTRLGPVCNDRWHRGFFPRQNQRVEDEVFKNCP